MEQPITCNIFKSPRWQYMYLYLPSREGFDELPETLRKYFGEPIHVMELELTPQRNLANAEAPKVLAALREQGFYLQMPPSEPLPI